MNKEISIDNAYDYEHIEQFAEENDYEMDELGQFEVGLRFITLKKGESTISFVLDGATMSTTIYKCIYKT